MAEPARQLSPYDRDDSAPVTRPNLRALEGGGESTPRKAGHLSSVAGGEKGGLAPSLLKKNEEGAEHGGLKLIHGGKDAAKDALVKGALGPEASAALSAGQKIKEALWGNKDKRNRTLFGGGVAGAVISIFVLLFVAILPHKISLMVEHLQNRFFATTQQALGDETENMFDTYLRKHVFPGLGPHCPSTKADKSCAAEIKGSGPVAEAYQQWRLKNVEGKLATKYGIEFQRVGNGSTARISVKIGNHTQVLNETEDVFKQISQAEARQTLRDAVARETRFKQVFLRFQLRGIMDKYGIRRCIIACDLRDKWTDSVADKKRAVIAFLATRVLAPRFAGLSIAIQCIMNTDCKPQDVTPNTADGENGAPVSDYEKQLSEEMQRFAAKFGEDALKDLLKSTQELIDKGFTKYMVDSIAKGVGKLTGKEAASKAAGEVAGKAVPFIGWANLAAEVIDLLGHLGPKIRKMTYVTNVIPMIGMWTTYRTVVDESKSGHVDTTELGSFAESLAPSDKGPGAETAPLYGKLFESSTSSGTTALLRAFLPQKAYAASTTLQNQKYLNFCDGDDPDNPDPTKDTKKGVPAGKLICPEESLVAGNSIISGISSAIPGPIQAIASFWNSTVGKVFKFIGDLFADIPGIKQLGGFVSEIIAPLLKMIIQWLIPNPFHTNMSGARIFDTMAGGGDAVGNEACHQELGCKEGTPQQVADVVNKQLAEEERQFQNKSFWARMFDSNDEHSLVGQIALAMPYSARDTAQASFASLLTNPFNKLISGFSAMFTTNHAFAATTATDDPFGINQYYYPDNELPADPEAYWTQHCQDGKQTENWNSDAAKEENHDPLTEMPVNHSTDPCLLIQATAKSAGNVF